jgi:hypothetical protein
VTSDECCGLVLTFDLVTDYGAENPLLMDYYGFPEEVNNIYILSSSLY